MRRRLLEVCCDDIGALIEPQCAFERRFAHHRRSYDSGRNKQGKVVRARGLALAQQWLEIAIIGDAADQEREQLSDV